MINSIDEFGFEMLDDFISQDWLETILNEIETNKLSTEVSGVRNIDKKLNSVFDYVNSTQFKQQSSVYFSNRAQLVRAILFNKTPESNWFVTWHQDKTVTVSKQFQDENWNVWSVKEGVIHVQPPLELLENMVTIRLHLDAAPKENGCLKVIPRSHQLGLLTSEKINDVVASQEATYCEAKQGSALIMRPHLLHASSKSTLPINRRVLHLELSDWVLPSGVSWN